jgi:hypothetical protein
MTNEERTARVRALLAAAKRLRDRPPDAPDARRLRDDLIRSTGLSEEGVALGITRYLETEASSGDLSALVDRAGDAPRVWVVLSANVFIASLRAIAIAVAASEDVRVRPSRREPAFTTALYQALLSEGSPPFVIVDELLPEPGDEVHLYGRDETISSLRSRLPASVRTREHRSGLGVAVLETGSDRSRPADDLSWDVIAFDQRGCLSPRIVVVPGTGQAPEAYAAAISSALERRAREVPRGALLDGERAAGGTVDVTDTGSGIDSLERPFIFNRFI